MLAVVGILLLGGSRSQAASSRGKGVVQVAFNSPPGSLTTADRAAIPTEYRRVLLNVVAVRLNASSDLEFPDRGKGWVQILAPASAGSSLVQLDLEALQNLPFLFNAVSIPAKTYGQVELVLNSVNPGIVVPLCSSAIEGCMPKSVTLTTNKLRALFTGGYDVTRNTTQPLVISIGGTLGPGTSMAPVITPGDSSALGLVTGTVTNFNLKTTKVTAEFSGTNQIVAATKLQKDGTFSLNLPALDASGGGTFYDFYVSGNGGYVVRSHQQVFASGPPLDLLTLAVPSSKLSSINGAVYDGCVGTTKPIEGATLQLFVPDTTDPANTTDCDHLTPELTIPSNCVVVGTANTDQLGFYPLLGSIPQAFNRVPTTLPSDVTHYALEISAPGYNTTLQQVAKGTHAGLNCPTAGFKGDTCSFNLEHGYLEGTVALSRSNDTGNTLDVMVNAEDSGTNKIENFTFARIPAGETVGKFSMPVPHGTPGAATIASSEISGPSASPSSTPTPVTIPVNRYDVFAVVQDLFGGTSQKISGHLITAAAGIAAPPPSPTPTPTPSSTPSSSPSPRACVTATPPVSLSVLADCAGQGSVYGTVSGANPATTSVRLSGTDETNGTPVQIDQTQPNSIASPSGFYNFCAPADTYTVTHYESGSPAASPAPVTLAAPSTTPTPCTGSCRNTVGPSL
jgi:hypothetical protein